MPPEFSLGHFLKTLDFRNSLHSKPLKISTRAWPTSAATGENTSPDCLFSQR